MKVVELGREYSSWQFFLPPCDRRTSLLSAAALSSAGWLDFKTPSHSAALPPQRAERPRTAGIGCCIPLSVQDEGK